MSVRTISEVSQALVKSGSGSWVLLEFSVIRHPEMIVRETTYRHSQHRKWPRLSALSTKTQVLDHSVRLTGPVAESAIIAIPQLSPGFK